MPSSSLKKLSVPAQNLKSQNLILPLYKGKRPKILFFESDLSRITLGEPIHLKWKVENATRVIIRPKVGLVTEEGIISVYPDETSQYTLIAYNSFGKINAKLTVHLPPPRIAYFKAAEEEITIGYPTILHWEAENADQIFLDKGVGELDALVSFKEVFFEVPGPCTLTVINKSGRDSKRIYLKLSLPDISYFWASSDTIRLGHAISLHWKVSNAKELFIDQGIGEMSTTSKIEVFPDRTITYTLIASNHRGTIQKTLSLVLPPPKIVSFEPEDEVLIDGKPSTKLFWNIENAHTIRIDPDIGEVTDQDYVVVKPATACMTYTLTAIGHSGTASAFTQIRKFPIPLEVDLLNHTNNRAAGRRIQQNAVFTSKDFDANLEASLDEMKRELLNATKEIKRLKKKKRVNKEVNYANIEITADMLKLEKTRFSEEIVNIFRGSILNFLSRIKKIS